MTSEHRVIITGATGFIGSRLAERLVLEGWDVHTIMRRDSDTSQLRSIVDKIRLHEHDGTFASMVRIFEQVPPCPVFHLASYFSAQHNGAEIAPMIQSNLVFGTQLVEAMIQTGHHQMLNTGTAWQHYESGEYSPVCLYAATKQAFESILQFYAETAGLRVITLKLFDTYGPMDPRKKVFAMLEKTRLEHASLDMSLGKQWMDLVFIDDVVNAFVVAASLLRTKQSVEMEHYAVSSGQSVQIRDLVDIYERVTGTKLSIQWGARPCRPREMMFPWTVGQPLPNWQATVSLEEGIKRMLEAE